MKRSKNNDKSILEYLDRRINDIKNYLKFNERSEDEDNFSPSYELKICEIAKNTFEAKIQNDKDTILLNTILKKRVNLEELFLLIRIRKDEALKVYNASRKVGYKLTDDEFNQIKERKFLINGKF